MRIAVAAVATALAGLLSACREQPQPSTSSAQSADSCALERAAQNRYLEQEPHAAQYRFDEFSVAVDSSLSAALDPNSSPYTNEFKTRLREELRRVGTNFAGHYSLVPVGMTGWGNNYWIVNRRNGQAHEFPYFAAALDFRPNSRLIVLNPKDSIDKLLAVPDGGCYYLNQQRVTELRPFYFSWENDSLKLIAPRDLAPPVNSFWVDYLSGIPDTVPAHVSHFIRRVRTAVIAHSSRVPREGYNGFMIVQALPGILPDDLHGITTNGGQYDAVNGVLHFTGNGSSDAPNLTHAGYTTLLERLARRLARPATNVSEVDSIMSALAR